MDTQQWVSFHCRRAAKYFILLSTMWMSLSLHVKWPIFLSDFNKTWILLAVFKVFVYQISWKYVLYETHWYRRCSNLCESIGKWKRLPERVCIELAENVNVVILLTYYTSSCYVTQCLSCLSRDRSEAYSERKTVCCFWVVANMSKWRSSHLKRFLAILIARLRACVRRTSVGLIEASWPTSSSVSCTETLIPLFLRPQK